MEKKTVHLIHRCTPARKKAVERAAKADGRKVSSWLDKVISDALTKKKEP